MKNPKSVFILFIAILSILLFVGFKSIKPSNNSIAVAKTFYLIPLKTLVSNKTLTQTQSNQVFTEILKNVNEGKGCIDELKELVDSNIINKMQANTINQIVQKDRKRDMEREWWLRVKK